ncbi:M16 family metallopeptidase [Campylobacter sp. RM16187]|uniref:M16 family metallopeptidase n=1 Tax=Campylobacter sp. RM16187 TaxID=1660063 RepID=UPI0021B5050A|nr:M16 family metallopeptidase [Campylobacter sp. RM16187]QKG29539.1 zinc-dependent peptidase, M16 family [Campylobacter sp. RM16187]
MRKILLLLITVIGLFALSQDANLTSGTLENGLKYYIKENRLPENKAYFQLVVRAGSADEKPSELGLAHFVEHMAFNGSRDFSKNELIQKLESLGVAFGADLNAYTTYDSTAYMLNIEVNERNLKDVFLVFRNWMDGINFDKDELDKERGVIIEEDRSRNTPEYRLYKLHWDDLLEGSIYASRTPIGDMNIVRNVSVSQMKDFYNRMYQPRLMEFVAVGDFKKDEILDYIKDSFSSVKNTNYGTKANRTIPAKNGLYVYNYDSNETAENSIKISFFDKFSPRQTESQIRKAIINLYISNLINTLYEEKTNRENSIQRAVFTNMPIQAQKTMYSFDMKIIGDKQGDSIKDMLSVINGIKIHGFSQSDFDDEKKNLINIINNRYLQSKSKKSADYLRDIVYALELGNVILSDIDSRNLSLKILNEITLDEVNAEFRRILSLDEKSVSIFSSKGYRLGKEKFEQLANDIKPYTSHLKSFKLPSKLINKEIKPGKIISKKFDEKHKIWSYTLENNATVILKTLKNEKNLISFAAVSKGGVSNLARPQLGEFATTLSNESGAGEFNNYQISKILNGKYLSYQKRISSLSHGFYGKSSTGDIESLMEAIYLEFNSPRVDDDMLKKIKTKRIEDLAKRESLPSYKFSKEFSEFYYNGNERKKHFSRSDIEAVKINDLKDIVNDKFTNASSYAFVFVGDFKETDMEPLIKKYIATLPAKFNSENFIDDGVRGLDGVHIFERFYQTSNRSDVIVKMKNVQNEYSKFDLIKISALGEVLKMALRENIREEKGETYGISLSTRLNKHPYIHSRVDISFTTSPQKLDSVLDGIKKTISNLKSEGALDRYIQSYKKSTILKLKQKYEQSGFWLNELVSSKIYDNEIFSLDEYEKFVSMITNEDIKNAAKLYLKEDNMIIGINSPIK